MHKTSRRKLFHMKHTTVEFRKNKKAQTSENLIAYGLHNGFVQFFYFKCQIESFAKNVFFVAEYQISTPQIILMNQFVNVVSHYSNKCLNPIAILLASIGTKIWSSSKTSNIPNQRKIAIFFLNILFWRYEATQCCSFV